MSQDDDLQELRALFDEATPKADPARKAEAVAMAMKNFDRAQETASELRPTPESPEKGLFKGVRQMFAKLSTRGILTASTALAAVALVALVPVLRDQTPPSGRDVIEVGPVVVLEEPDEIMEPVMVEEAEPMVLVEPSLGFAPPASAPRAKMALDAAVAPEPDSEAFANADPNPIKVTAEEPVSTFSIDVDTASWSVIRNSLNWGQLPPKEAVRIEEMVNYFHYDYPAPEDGEAFSTSVGVSDSPWRAGTKLVHIGLQGAMPATRPPLNLVFLIDTSGSMSDPNKLPLLVQSFRLMLGQLGAEDQVSIVTYAGSAGRVLDPTPASERDVILSALERLEAGGSTAGQEGLEQAYATATEMAREEAVSRVILATDGDFNVGISDPEALEDFIAGQRDSGTYLSVLGFGRGNLDDAVMQALAQTGNGMAAYIDTLAEAQKVLVDQLTGALVPIANDVKIQVEWNPAQVAEYRLIGYETRALRREDFNNDRVDAGEIGAGHQVTAIYEITPVGSGARLTDPLRYGSESFGESEELGFLRLRYKTPGESESQLIERPIVAGDAPLPEADWATAIAGFGQVLQGSELIGEWGLAEAIALAQRARGEDAFGYRQEAITLMRLAESLQR
ncbi:vWA domain-containing protein [Tropicibacter naphthalenivorans]|uniref:Marine proteobacterial sortase target protein n=1 Tax=Tropicibacter naphthalenivorans TaxID=441103 RepID=A0A0P1GDN2_9RHOB|nr:VWA domain-containing protein [Tropicibacter naphthalenivorans]CUH79354.1 marine proteobacterial sortase target protein [Tropicibacter naphthalenivorans]SMC71558.1 Ca-activated chloride channel family protein [Tropicibacter naphthalenivorans]